MQYFVCDDETVHGNDLPLKATIGSTSVFMSVWRSSMKAITAPRLPRPICRPESQFFLNTSKSIHLSFALGFDDILAVAR